VTVALVIGVCDLLPELLADALVLLGPLKPAGTVATGALQTVFHHLDDFFIFV